MKKYVVYMYINENTINHLHGNDSTSSKQIMVEVYEHDE